MRTLLLMFRIAAVAGAAALPLAAAPADATMFRGDARGSGRQAAGSVEWIGSVRFTVDAAAPIRGSPIVHRGVLFVGSSDGTLHAIDAVSGAVRWRVQLGGAITATPAAEGDTLYLTSRDGWLRALETATGAERWRAALGADLGDQNYWDFFMSSPVLADGLLFVGSGDGHLYAMDPADGRVRWRFDAKARVRSTPAVADGTVVFGTMSGEVHALRTRDGAPRWKFATEGASKTFAEQGNDTTSIFASPTIMDGIVAIGARDGFLYGIDLASGAQRWRTTHDGSSWILSTAFDGRTLFVGSGSASIVQAADPATGQERWRFKTRGAVFSSLALAGDTLLVTDFSGTLHALDRHSGALRWQFAMGARSLSTPLVAGGTVYAASDRGTLFALSAAAAPRSSRGPARRIVYFEGPRSPQAFGWFANGVDAAALAHFTNAGYEPMSAAQLAELMRRQDAAAPPAVVVFADNRFPASVVDDSNGAPLVRRFLDAGGKIALLGPNPLAYKTDPSTGALTDLDYELPQRVFGVRFPEPRLVGGYYPSTPTAAGRAMGMRHGFVGYPSIDAQAGVAVLASDEYGRAGAWLRSYGGAPGSGLLQLALPRQETPDYAEVQAVIEFGMTW